MSSPFPSSMPTVSTAESLTCGMIASEIGGYSGVSKWFRGGVVTYSNEAKIKLLNTEPEETMRDNGVSENIAKMMAKGVTELMDTDIGISSTGYAERYYDENNKKDIEQMAYTSIYNRKTDTYMCFLFTVIRGNVKVTGYKSNYKL